MRFECKGKLDILSITAKETLNSIKTLILTSLVPKIFVRVFKILVNSRKLLGFTFSMFSIILCFKRTHSELYSVHWRHGTEV